MGLIPKVDKPSPAFVHVDVDDPWAVANCYGYDVAAQWAHYISNDALPRFQQLFEEAGVSATFFVVGQDLEHADYTGKLKALLEAGHRAANHSWSHSLRFRAMAPSEMSEEIDKAHSIITDRLGTAPKGFRAPGYAWSQQLVTLLEDKGYKYDASLMPGPYGSVFRWMDSRMQQPGTTPALKTQYPLLYDAFHSLYPTPVRGGRLIEIPSATAPLARLPFQAGVCMRLGYGYFRACFDPYRWNKALPFVFLFHAADVADFSNVPYPLFRKSKFFNLPVTYRLNLARRFLATIRQHRPVVTTEDWLTQDS